MFGLVLHFFTKDDEIRAFLISRKITEKKLGDFCLSFESIVAQIRRFNPPAAASGNRAFISTLSDSSSNNAEVFYPPSDEEIDRAISPDFIKILSEEITCQFEMESD